MMPAPFHALGRMTVAEVNIPVAVLIWLMIVPMLIKVDFGALHQGHRTMARHRRHRRDQLAEVEAVQRMALLGWLFVGWLFRPLLPAGEIDSYIAGLILLAAAPCTAMVVFVWSNPDGRRAQFHLEPGGAQRTRDHGRRLCPDRRAVARPVSIDHGAVGDHCFCRSMLYIIVPVVGAHHCRRRQMLARVGGNGLAQLLRRLQPVSLLALLATLVLLFGFQGGQILRQPLVILLLAVPIVVQVYLNAGAAYALNRALGVPHNVACPSALIGASNFFELAVAAAIALFGFHSGAALATVVGVLVEVPVMLSVVRLTLRSRAWYERGAASPGLGKTG